jgi:hypothetical protein
LQGLAPFSGLTPVLIMVFGWATPTGVAAEIKFNVLIYYPANSHFLRGIGELTPIWSLGCQNMVNSMSTSFGSRFSNFCESFTQDPKQNPFYSRFYSLQRPQTCGLCLHGRCTLVFSDH